MRKQGATNKPGQMKTPLPRLRAERRYLSTIACAFLLETASVRALNIVLVYDDLGENPRSDPNGTALMAIAQAAQSSTGPAPMKNSPSTLRAGSGTYSRHLSGQ